MKPISLQYAEQRLRQALDADDLAAIEQWGELVDMLDVKLPTPTLGDAAMWYASIGLHVFRLSPRSKKPLPRTHGLRDATTDQRQISMWWGEQPSCNIGIATGHLVDVVDVDGADGEVSLCKLLDENPAYLADALGVVSTPRPGGRHFYVRAAPDVINGQSVGIEHIDVRGSGGYVVAPPSVIESPTISGVYVWVRPIDVSALMTGKT